MITNLPVNFFESYLATYHVTLSFGFLRLFLVCYHPEVGQLKVNHLCLILFPAWYSGTTGKIVCGSNDTTYKPAVTSYFYEWPFEFVPKPTDYLGSLRYQWMNKRILLLIFVISTL